VGPIPALPGLLLGLFMYAIVKTLFYGLD
jgi:hypothetical protein